MKIHVEKDIYVPCGMYFTACINKNKNNHGASCDEFKDCLQEANDGSGRIVKCVDCLKAIQKELTQ